MIQHFFQEFPDIVAGITTQAYGNCSNTLIQPNTIPPFHQQLLSLYKMDSITVGKLIHTDRILNIPKDNSQQEADALITNTPKTLVGVTTADCIPVFLYDPIQQVVGVVHSGRKGLFLEITNKTIQKMIQEYNSDPSQIYIQIGPHICNTCYEVGSDILEEFGICIQQKKGYLPMQDILLSQLKKLDISNERIRLNQHCTLCSTDDNKQYIFYSHRRQEPQRMLSFIGLR